MKWPILLTFAIIWYSVSMASAAEPAKYTVDADATQNGNQIVLSIKITRVASESGTVITSTVTSPHITLMEGQSAELVIGSLGTATSLPQAAATPTTMQDASHVESGIKFNVISIKGQGKLIVVTNVIDSASTVWAEAQTISVVNQGKGNP